MVIHVTRTGRYEMKALKNKVMLVVLVVSMLLMSACNDSTANRNAVGQQFSNQGNALTGAMNAAYDAVH